MTSRWLPAAVLAVAVSMTGCDDATTEPAPPSAEAPSTSVVECPEGPATGFVPADRPAPDLPGEVPAGATSARLCAGGEEYAQVTPPRDALTVGVETLVRAVNQQPPVGPPGHCARQSGPTYRMAFGYPDGSRFVVAGTLARCSPLVVGNGWRADSSPPLQTFIRRLRAQRSTRQPPGPTTAPGRLTCGQRSDYAWTWPLHQPNDLASAILCYGQPNHPRLARRVTVPPRQLSVLIASMRTDTVSVVGLLRCPPWPGREFWLVGESAWGDPIAARKLCEGIPVRGGREWAPHERARRVVDRLISAARPTP